MPRVVFSGDYYEYVDSRSWYERDYEKFVDSVSSELFPRWNFVRFSADVRGDDGSVRRPDAALIDLRYREWWVVEIELCHHDLHSHVLPQVEVFRSGTYDASHARALAAKNNSLDEDRLNEMMKGVPPGVIVIVDSPSTDWEKPLLGVNVRLGIAEPFRNLHGKLMVRLNGFQPEPPGDLLTRCSRSQFSRRLWKVHSPATLPDVGVDEMLTIEVDGQNTKWRTVKTNDALFMRPQRGGLLQDYSIVEIHQREDNSMTILPILRSTGSH